MTKDQKAVLDTVIKLSQASELDVCNNCSYTNRCIHNALRTLKRNGILDTDDDGRYFAVSTRNAGRPACEISQDEAASLNGFYSGVEA